MPITDDDFRNWQVWHLQQDRARMWTPNLLDLMQLVIERINDKTSGNTKPNIGAAVDEVFEVLTKVQTRLMAEDVWKIPTPAPLPPPPA